MGVKKALSSVYRVLKLTRKSDRAEFMLYLKLVLLGAGIVGAIGFVIYFLASEVMLVYGIPATPSGTP